MILDPTSDRRDPRRDFPSFQNLQRVNEDRRVMTVINPDNTISVGVESRGGPVLRRLRRLLRRAMDSRYRARYWRVWERYPSSGTGGRVGFVGRDTRPALTLTLTRVWSYVLYFLHLINPLE